MVGNHTQYNQPSMVLPCTHQVIKKFHPFLQLLKGVGLLP